MHPETRGSLYLEQAELIKRDVHAAGQHVMRLRAPLTAAAAGPGSFVHIRCAEQLPLRRPLSIMRADKNAGWIELMYKVGGYGFKHLAGRDPGDVIDLVGPIGKTFKSRNYRSYPLLVGGGVGIPPMIFLAEHIRTLGEDIKPLVLMGSEIPFPFRARPSRIMLKGIPEGVTAAIPLLEDRGIPSRLASLQDYPGCYHGYVTELVELWLESLDADTRRQVELFSCGPMPMLKAVARIARRHRLGCEVALEEYMACGVGGCAACTVLVETERGPQMRRVCVDGPVFQADEVFPDIF